MSLRPHSRPLSVSQLISAVLGTYQARFGLIFKVTALGTGTSVIGSAAMGLFPPALANLVVFASYPVGAALFAALYACAFAAYRNERMTVYQAIQLGARRALFVFALFIVISLAVTLLAMTIIGIPFAIAIAARWSLAIPATIAERLAVDRALGRSNSLVKKRTWRTLGIFALFTLVVWTPVSILTQVLYWRVLVNPNFYAVVEPVAEPVGGMFRSFGVAQVAASLVVMAAITLVTPLWVLLTTVLYVDYRDQEWEAVQTVTTPDIFDTPRHLPRLPGGGDGLDI